MKHIFLVSGNDIGYTGNFITTGSTSDIAEFKFDESFTAPIKRAYFRNTLEGSEVATVVDIIDNSCIIPWNKIQFIGTLYIGIQGVSSSGLELFPTIYTEVEIKAGANGTGTDTPAIPETVIVNIKGDKGETGAQGIQGIQGIQGPKGDNGVDGLNGTNGVGVPVGGTAGQVLSKTDSTNYNTEWIDPPAGGGITPLYLARVYEIFQGTQPTIYTESEYLSKLNEGNLNGSYLYENDSNICGYYCTYSGGSSYSKLGIVINKRTGSYIKYYRDKLTARIISANAYGIDYNDNKIYLRNEFFYTNSTAAINYIFNYIDMPMLYVPTLVKNALTIKPLEEKR